MINRFFKKFFLVFFASLSFASYSQEILNPVPGEWNNMQTLVIDLPKGCNAYFSLVDKDPLVNGLAYDGPVVLEMAGEVKVNVAFVMDDGTTNMQSVSYYVSETSTMEETEITSFVSSVTKGVVDYVAGDIFEIPSELKYEFGSFTGSYEKGTKLSIPANANLSRYVPCTVTDGSRKWRFILKVHNSFDGILTRKDVPFLIKDWENLQLLDRSYIYKIDDQWWTPSGQTVKLNPYESHMISWQSVDYSQENPVKFFVLPPKPEVLSSVEKDGVEKIFFKTPSDYKMGILDSEGKAQALFDNLVFDTFKGDAFKSSVQVGFFHDSVLVGTRNFDFNINKKRPAPPLIESSSSNEFSRHPVEVRFSSPSHKVFVSVEGPVIVNEYTKDFSSLIFEVENQKYSEYRGGVIKLTPSTDGAAAYRISAFSRDSNGNESEHVSYSYVIDQCNFYIDGNKNNMANEMAGDGTKQNPFTSFEQLQPFLAKSRFLNVRIDGMVRLPDAKVVINTNCQFSGHKDARLLFGRKTVIEIKNASLGMDSIAFALFSEQEKEGIKLFNSSLFNVEHGVLELKNCLLSASFEKSGTVVNADSSVVQLRNCQFTCSASDYASILSSVQSKIYVSKSHLATMGSTCVMFSSTGGIFDLVENECTVSANLGRVAELFDTHSTVVKNIFTGEISSSNGKNKAIYSDSKNFTVEEKDNSTSGF